MSSSFERGVPQSPCFCPSWSLRYEFRQSFAPGKTDSNAGCRQFATVPETADASAQQNEGVALLNLNAVCLCGLDCQVSAVSSDCGWQLAASRFTWRAAHFSISDSPGVERHVSASTQNQALCALVFLYRQVLELDPGRLDGIRAKGTERMPVVLSHDEVRRILEACPSLRTT